MISNLISSLLFEYQHPVTFNKTRFDEKQLSHKAFLEMKCTFKECEKSHLERVTNCFKAKNGNSQLTADAKNIQWHERKCSAIADTIACIRQSSNWSQKMIKELKFKQNQFKGDFEQMTKSLELIEKKGQTIKNIEEKIGQIFDENDLKIKQLENELFIQTTKNIQIGNRLEKVESLLTHFMGYKKQLRKIIQIIKNRFSLIQQTIEAYQKQLKSATIQPKTQISIFFMTNIQKTNQLIIRFIKVSKNSIRILQNVKQTAKSVLNVFIQTFECLPSNGKIFLKKSAAFSVKAINASYQLICKPFNQLITLATAVMTIAITLKLGYLLLAISETAACYLYYHYHIEIGKKFTQIQLAIVGKP